MSDTPRTVSEIGSALRAGNLSAVEIARRALQEIRGAEPLLNAYITITEEIALAQAGEVDDELRKGLDRGPLMGIPVAIKDSIKTAGIPTTAASLALQAHVPAENAPVVTHLRNAGAILVGKTNMDELAYGYSPAFPRPNNPVDPRLSAAGSSGGSAATVASGAVPIALGGDAAGSVRIPAAVCGVTGFKPTWGRVDGRGTIPLTMSLDHIGAFGCTVACTRVLFGSVAEAPLREPRELPKPPRLGLVRGCYSSRDPRIEQGVSATIRAAESHGATIVERDIPEMEHWLAPFMVTLLPEATSLGQTFLRDSFDLLGSGTRASLLMGLDVTATAYLKAQRWRRKLCHEIDVVLGGIDALITATTTHVALAESPAWEDEDYWGELRWTSPFNLSGHPAVSIPAPVDGLPVGVQLVGLRGRDEALLDVAAWVEQASAAAGASRRADEG